MKTHPIRNSILLALLASATLAQAGTPVAAPVAEPVQSGDGWWFRAAPYVWLTAIEGDVGVGPISTPVDISIQDLVDNIDTLDMAFMGVFEVGYDRWSIGLDFMYMKVSQDIDGGDHVFDSFRFEQKQWFITPAVRYRVIETEDYNMSVFAGARVTAMSLDLTGRYAHRDGQVTRGSDKTWADPIVGIAGQANFADRWYFRYSGDIGGFGVNSDLIWNAFVGVGYNINDSASVVLGYRGQGTDYTDGPVSIDLISHGPVLGAEFNF